MCILKQVQLVHVSENTNILWGDLVDSTLSNPIDISKGVEFYLNESFNIDIYKKRGELFKNFVRTTKNNTALVKSSAELINSVIGSIKYKEAFLKPRPGRRLDYASSERIIKRTLPGLFTRFLRNRY